jgi:hypothetical protein
MVTSERAAVQQSEAHSNRRPSLTSSKLHSAGGKHRSAQVVLVTSRSKFITEHLKSIVCPQLYE